MKAGDRNDTEARIRRLRMEIPDTVPSEWIEAYRAENDAGSGHPGINQESDRFDTWQELERALSLVHVAGLDLVAEIKTGGEQSESVARQRCKKKLWRSSTMRLERSGSCQAPSDSLFRPRVKSPQSVCLR